jgi:hypothetical protein
MQRDLLSYPAYIAQEWVEVQPDLEATSVSRTPDFAAEAVVSNMDTQIGLRRGMTSAHNPQCLMILLCTELDLRRVVGRRGCFKHQALAVVRPGLLQPSDHLPKTPRYGEPWYTTQPPIKQLLGNLTQRRTTGKPHNGSRWDARPPAPSILAYHLPAYSLQHAGQNSQPRRATSTARDKRRLLLPPQRAKAVQSAC